MAIWRRCFLGANQGESEANYRQMETGMCQTGHSCELSEEGLDEFRDTTS